MPVAETLRNTMLDAIPSPLYVEAFDGDPEGAGVTQSDRVSQTFAAASGGSRAASTQPGLAVGAGNTVAWLGWFTGPAGGTPVATSDVADEVFGGAGTYTVNSTTFTLNNA